MSEGGKPTIYYFDKLSLHHYANETEPKIYPHAFEKLVMLESYQALQTELEKYKTALSEAMQYCEPLMIKELNKFLSRKKEEG